MRCPRNILRTPEKKTTFIKILQLGKEKGNDKVIHVLKIKNMLPKVDRYV